MRSTGSQAPRVEDGAAQVPYLIDVERRYGILNYMNKDSLTRGHIIEFPRQRREVPGGNCLASAPLFGPRQFSHRRRMGVAGLWDVSILV